MKSDRKSIHRKKGAWDTDRQTVSRLLQFMLMGRSWEREIKDTKIAAMT